MPEPQQSTSPTTPTLPPGMVLTKPAATLPAGMSLARAAVPTERQQAASPTIDRTAPPEPQPVHQGYQDPVAMAAQVIHDKGVAGMAAYRTWMQQTPVGKFAAAHIDPIIKPFSDWLEAHPMATSSAAKASMVLGPPPELDTPDAAAAFAKAHGPQNTKNAKDFMSAIPPTRSNPYDLGDYSAGRPFVEAEHEANPVRESVGVQDVVDNHNEAIGKIDSWIKDRIALTPNDKLPNDVMVTVKAKLAANAAGDSTYVEKGLADLERFDISKDTTIPQADDIRQRLNAENQGILQRNNYKQATAREVDPGFYARETAAAALREGIYDNLAARGTPGAQEMRQTQGSLIKVRNAAEAQIFNGDKVVRGSNSPNIVQKLADQALPSAGRALLPKGVNNLITPEDLTRNELAARSFKNSTEPQPEYPGGPVKPLPEPQPKGQLPLEPQPPKPPTPETNPQLGLFNTEPSQIRGGPGTTATPTRAGDTELNRPVASITQGALPPGNPQSATLKSAAEMKMEDFLRSRLPARSQEQVGLKNVTSREAVEELRRRMYAPDADTVEKGTLGFGVGNGKIGGSYFIEPNGAVHGGANMTHDQILQDMPGLQPHEDIAGKLDEEGEWDLDANEEESQKAISSYMSRTNTLRINADGGTVNIQSHNGEITPDQMQGIASIFKKTYTDELFADLGGKKTITARTMGDFKRQYEALQQSKLADTTSTTGLDKLKARLLKPFVKDPEAGVFKIGHGPGTTEPYTLKFKTGEPVEFNAYHSIGDPHNETTNFRTGSGGTFFHGDAAGNEYGDEGTGVTPVRLKFNNPLVVGDQWDALGHLLPDKESKRLGEILSEFADEGGSNHDRYKMVDKEIAKAAIAKGHDGIIYNDQALTQHEYVALDPKAIDYTNRKLPNSAFAEYPKPASTSTLGEAMRPNKFFMKDAKNVEAQALKLNDVNKERDLIVAARKAKFITDKTAARFINDSLKRASARGTNFLNKNLLGD